MTSVPWFSFSYFSGSSDEIAYPPQVEFSPSSKKVRLISTGYFRLSFSAFALFYVVFLPLLYSSFPRLLPFSLCFSASVALTSTPFFPLWAVEFSFTLQLVFVFLMSFRDQTGDFSLPHRLDGGGGME